MTQIIVANVVEARNLKNADLFDKINPVVKIYTGRGFTSKGKTSVRNNDANPTWNESFSLKFDNSHHELHVELRDRKMNGLDKDKVGTAIISLAPLATSGSMDSWHLLTSKHGKSVGEIHLAIMSQN
ncbi:hypothetical protein K493DRAFT_311783 [Basidiobolus meristosporus CBS 931.73]|uniref:C2 domain-containing protein n=1 Tax=Basidiobolus meristosporus CBS 931.73 TaxID=1314790 RepID=A0A1Y1YYZ5_9FUNG|nr:hypothetical protein K493DRAFT_311783 [Basidiobolus meristosporus CBS 931.73]|eukprot:ORY03278.1 hypothetical protein K493DRAFT_311783 [Basidiobolus meristosporus CBS 931.73]